MKILKAVALAGALVLTLVAPAAAAPTQPVATVSGSVLPGTVLFQGTTYYQIAVTAELVSGSPGSVNSTQYQAYSCDGGAGAAGTIPWKNRSASWTIIFPTYCAIGQYSGSYTIQLFDPQVINGVYTLVPFSNLFTGQLP